MNACCVPGRRSAALLLILLLAGPAAPLPAKEKPAAAPPAFEMTVDNIMRGPGLLGYEPRSVRWSGDSRRVYFEWKKAGEPQEKNYDTYVADRDNSGLRKLSEEEAKDAPPIRADASKDKKLAVYVEEGDVFLHSEGGEKRRQVTKTTDAESNPHFTSRLINGQRHIYFTRANNLYLMSLETGSLVQLTDIRLPGAAPAAPAAGGFGQGRRPVAQVDGEQKGTDSQEYLKKEERELLDVIKRRAQKREEDEAKRKRENPRKPFTLQARQSVSSLQLSPDQKYVVAAISETGEGVKNTIVPNFVTESVYTEDIPGRTKVGDNQARARLGILNVETGEMKWVETGIRDQKAAPPAPPAPLAPRERDVQLSSPVWSEDGAKAVLVARSADNKDRWIMALDPATAKTRVIFSDHDDAWIGGPGMFTLGWMKDDQHIYFQSEREGYSHLYTVSCEGGEPRQLTSGKWEVTGVQLSEDKTRFFLSTSEGGPWERHFYAMPAEGGERLRITSNPGSHQALVSPDEKTLAVIYSFANKPPELYLQENRPGASALQVTSSPAPEFAKYPWTDPPIVTFAARDGVMVPARLYKPKNYKPGGPAVIFVHGAGYLQNVSRWWSSYSHEYMFHHLLMEHGYLVADVDYRASAGYGRNWRTAIYEHMGGKDLEDQVDAARWLVREHGVDPGRIGIYGGSYGGFITLMAMFTQPGVFAAGAALRPVTDWASYNHGYTSNILNLPQKDAEAYRKSSPIYFAKGLKGALLICHGMADTNVHFQDTVRLVEKLIELRKENWELAVFPVEDHTFVEAASWADEYKRIFKLFETNLKKIRRAGESPAGKRGRSGR